jgi:hypothetical protein
MIKQLRFDHEPGIMPNEEVLGEDRTETKSCWAKRRD